MTMFGVAWGHALQGVRPATKLVAIRLGDHCDHEGCGRAELADLAEWSCCTVAEVFTALEELRDSAGIQVEVFSGYVSFRLPDDAHVPAHRPRGAPSRALSIYVMRGKAGTKVGITSDVNPRVLALRSSTLDDSIELVSSWSGPEASIRKAERHAHLLLRAKLIRNEWFNVTPDEAQAAVVAALAEQKDKK